MHRIRTPSPLRALFAAVLALTPLAAEPFDELKGLEDRRAVVRLRDGSSAKGRLERVEGRELTVDGRQFACSDVSEVRIKRSSWRGLWTAIGAGGGLAAGLALGVRFSNEANDAAAALTAAGLAGAGAVIGFFAGAAKSTTLTVDPASCS